MVLKGIFGHYTSKLRLLKYTLGFLLFALSNTVLAVCEGDSTFCQIVENHGFLFESHQVKSQGYLLTLYRIPGKQSQEEQEKPGPPILFQHGLFDSAFAWVVHHADRAPAYLASEAGYDVWLTNSRGSGPSRKHQTLDPNDHQS